MVDTTCWQIGKLKTRQLQQARDKQLREGGRLSYSEDNGATWREVGLHEALALHESKVRKSELAAEVVAISDAPNKTFKPGQKVRLTQDVKDLRAGLETEVGMGGWQRQASPGMVMIVHPDFFGTCVPVPVEALEAI